MIVNEKNYWIWNDIFVFKPEFNSNLEKYVNLISKYDKIIFSEFSSFDDTKKMYEESFLNKIIIYNYHDMNASLFNENIDILPNNIKYLILGYDFNQQIKKLPNDLEILIFSYSFNNKIFSFPQKIQKLYFGNKFNQDIVVPSTLKYLFLGYDFNKKIIFNENLTHLGLSKNFSQNLDLPFNVIFLDLELSKTNSNILDNLPDSIETLVISGYSKDEHYMDNLPTSITNLIINNEYFNSQLNNLPNSIKYLRLNPEYCQKFEKIPKNLKIIECLNLYKYKDFFVSKGYEVITYHKSFFSWKIF